MQLAFVVALVFAIAVAVFAVQNTTPVDVSFLFFQAQQVAVSVLVLINVLVGAALMLLVGLGREVRRTMALRALRRELADKERRIHELEAQVGQTTAPEAAAQPAEPSTPALPQPPQS